MQLCIFVLFLGLTVNIDAFSLNYWKFKSLVQRNALQQHAAWHKSLPLPQVPPLPVSRVIMQPLNHFDPQLKETYGQRYWVNSQYWDPRDGPVFIYIGGEGSLSEFASVRGAYVEYAQMYNALIFAVEHRFYGQSMNDDGLQTKNLQHLSSQQALADLANFHFKMSKMYNLTENNKWISFGGSYPGCLSAWFRIKYPHLVHGAIASSAPVRAVVNFEGYNDVVAKSLSTTLVGGSEKCADMVRQAFQKMDQLLSQGDVDKVFRDFLSCKPKNNDLDIYQLTSNLAGIFMGIVQYNNEHLPSLTIKSVCEIMTQDTDAYQNLIALNQKFLQQSAQNCSDNSWESFIGQLSNVTFDRSQDVNMRQWVYQTCAQFGYYQTCDDKDCLFSRFMTLPPNFDICKILYGLSEKDVFDNVDFSNSYYGSDQPRGSNIVFVNGLIDPWHALSVLKDMAGTEMALVIPGTAHCADLHNEAPSDPPELKEARKKIIGQIAKWLSEPNAALRRNRKGLSPFQIL